MYDEHVVICGRIQAGDLILTQGGWRLVDEDDPAIGKNAKCYVVRRQGGAAEQKPKAPRPDNSYLADHKRRSGHV